MPSSLNLRKSDKVEQRQLDLAKKFALPGLLSEGEAKALRMGSIRLSK